MRKAFSEAVEGAVEPPTTEVQAARTDMRNLEDRNMDRVNKRIDAETQVGTTNQNMTAQFSAQEEKIGKLIKDRGPAAK